ncbi:hypothetical protein [Mesorhizobium kowhaii]|uniref:Uncharacterized protein n=1 Tax=Mesorhizobium kowhaii TaxID=1300272 RepID=A0A2W7E959_9HYPH|nr:hypothetical protein [Mesorhizobium kowhaii]PZV39756.1 hypothetical protein B5V02_07465 [Mesorhizobium kowhaii]
MQGFAAKLVVRAKERALAQAEDGETLRNQIAETYKSLAELSEHLKASDMAAERLKIYKPKYGSDYSCPICWQERGAIKWLLFVEEPDHAYHCKICGFKEADDGQLKKPAT